MPLYLWVGNPFCFPCIPLRVVAFLPAGLIAMVMTFAPIMGFAKNRLLPFAPKELQDEIGEVANTFWMIGLIFWVILGSVLFISVCVWYHYCREEDEESSCCLCPCRKKQSETLLRNWRIFTIVIKKAVHQMDRGNKAFTIEDQIILRFHQFVL